MLQKTKYWIRNYFGFSHNETRGFIILMGLLVLLIFLPSLVGLIPWHETQPTKDSIAKLDSLVTKMEQNLPENPSYASYPSSKPKEHQIRSKQNFFPFDPNEIGVEEWKKLGLREKIAHNILKYRNKGGRFRYKEDLQKVYGFPEELFHQLLPYIQLPSKEEKKHQTYPQDSKESTKSNSTNKESITQFELNQADTNTLKRIKGIGNVLAQRIVNFREKLGGFHSLNQVAEVYGISPETIEELTKYAYINSPVRQISLNKATLNELQSHPYIGYKTGKIIYNYRQQNGLFANKEDLLKIKALDAEFLNKLAPYLKL